MVEDEDESAAIPREEADKPTARDISMII